MEEKIDDSKLLDYLAIFNDIYLKENKVSSNILNNTLLDYDTLDTIENESIELIKEDIEYVGETNYLDIINSEKFLDLIKDVNNIELFKLFTIKMYDGNKLTLENINNFYSDYELIKNEKHPKNIDFLRKKIYKNLQIYKLDPSISIFLPYIYNLYGLDYNESVGNKLNELNIINKEKENIYSYLYNMYNTNKIDYNTLYNLLIN